MYTTNISTSTVEKVPISFKHKRNIFSYCLFYKIWLNSIKILQFLPTGKQPFLQGWCSQNYCQLLCLHLTFQLQGLVVMENLWPKATYFQKWEVNTVITKHFLPKEKIADIYSAWCLYANSWTFSSQRLLFLQHLTPYFIAFLVQLGWIFVHSQILLIIYIYTFYTNARY